MVLGKTVTKKGFLLINLVHVLVIVLPAKQKWDICIALLVVVLSSAASA